jgi:hypothetical protein
MDVMGHHALRVPLFAIDTHGAVCEVALYFEWGKLIGHLVSGMSTDAALLLISSDKNITGVVKRSTSSDSPLHCGHEALSAGLARQLVE